MWWWGEANICLQPDSACAGWGVMLPYYLIQRQVNIVFTTRPLSDNTLPSFLMPSWIKRSRIGSRVPCSWFMPAESHLNWLHPAASGGPCAVPLWQYPGHNLGFCLSELLYIQHSSHLWNPSPCKRWNQLVCLKLSLLEEGVTLTSLLISQSWQEGRNFLAHLLL